MRTAGGRALVDLQLAHCSEPRVFRILERFSQLLVDAKEVLWNSRAEADDQSGQIHGLAPMILDLHTDEVEGVSRTRRCCRSGRPDASISRGGLRNQEDAPLTGERGVSGTNRFQRRLGNHQSICRIRTNIDPRSGPGHRQQT